MVVDKAHVQICMILSWLRALEPQRELWSPLKTSNWLNLKQILILNDISENPHGRRDKGEGSGFTTFYLWSPCKSEGWLNSERKSCNFHHVENQEEHRWLPHCLLLALFSQMTSLACFIDVLCLQDLNLHGHQFTHSPGVGREECPHGIGSAVAPMAAWQLWQWAVCHCSYSQREQQTWPIHLLFMYSATPSY